MLGDLHGKGLHTVVTLQFLADVPQLEKNFLHDIFHVLRVVQQATGTSRQLPPEWYDFYFKLFLFHSINKTRNLDKHNMDNVPIY